MDFSVWRENAEALFLQRYAIDLDDLGLTEGELEASHRRDPEPNEFVERFALKFDLDPLPYAGR